MAQIKTTPMAVKMQHAKRLYVYQIKTAVSISKKIGVTPKTMSRWVNAFGWKALRDDVILKRLSTNAKDLQPAEITINDLFEYIKENAPAIASKVEQLFKNYINLIA